jgi:hypothetical protein
LAFPGVGEALGLGLELWGYPYWGGYYNPYWGGYYGIHIGAGMADTGVIITQYHTKEEEQTEDYITATMEDLVIEMV